MTGPQERTAVFSLLIVCTGNICRSAFAERLGRAYLDEVLGDEAGLIRLSSAGTGAVVGSHMHPDSALVLRGFGGESSDFVARQVDPALIAQADLVLTMTRQHRRAVLQMVPRALNKTFTLREAADVVRYLDGAPASGADLAERARGLVRQMAASRSRRTAGDDDVPDPINRPIEAHQRVGELIAEALILLLERIVALHEDDGVAAPQTEVAER